MEQESLLDNLRVLDLTEGGYLVCGLLLGQMGADVIKIEPPCGSPSRNRGPFYKDIPDSERSLYWFAYNVNKRGITLDIEKADGRDIFKRLVKTADIVLESFPPGYMDGIGLSYSALCETKPDIILVSISAYGQEGPKSHYKASDITTWASGSFMHMIGDSDRAPLQVTFPQSEINGGTRAAGGALTALFHREMTGEGQVVDVRSQLEIAWNNEQGVGAYECEQRHQVRQGTSGIIRNVKFPVVVRCKDGDVIALIMGGAAAGIAGSSERIVKWMDEEGMATEQLKKIDWYWGFDAFKLTQEQYDAVAEPIRKFFLTITKAEYDEQVVKRGIIAGALNDVKDIAESHHLAARDFWVKLEHPELDDTLTYCGPLAKLSEAPIRITRRAPLIGEHNEEIYQKELGLSKVEILILKQAQVI